MKISSLCFLAIALCCVAPGLCDAQPAGSVSEQIAAIKSVSQRGKGHDQAQQAVLQLQQKDTRVLLPILFALGDANPLAANWLRNAFETVASRALKNNKPLPEKDLLDFVRKTKHHPAARRLAFEWLRKIDSSEAEKMIDFFINDPSDELRRETVALYIAQAEKIAKENPDDKRGPCDFYKKALLGASDDDQVRKIIKGLKQCDIEIDVQHHYGFLNTWHIIGPFNNRERVGFAKVYPPEKEMKLSATYPSTFSEEISKVAWKKYTTDDSYGVLDLAIQIAPHKGAVDYAYTEFISDRNQPVEFRLSTPNAWKLWVNGKLLFEREEYHRGSHFDQYRVSGEFKKGKNTLLLKICQNEQEQSWAQKWQIQFRVCSPSGMAIHSVQNEN